MLKRFLLCFLLGGAVLFVASCTTKNEPKEDTPVVQETPAPKEPSVPKEPPPAKPNPRVVTLHVDGMSEQLKLI